MSKTVAPSVAPSLFAWLEKLPGPNSSTTISRFEHEALEGDARIAESTVGSPHPTLDGESARDDDTDDSPLIQVVPPNVHVTATASARPRVRLAASLATNATGKVNVTSHRTFRVRISTLAPDLDAFLSSSPE